MWGVRTALTWLGATSAVAMEIPRSLAQTEPKPESVWGDGPRQFKVATGRPGELGLLEVLAKQFANSNGATTTV